jgi:hypothetical protein
VSVFVFWNFHPRKLFHILYPIVLWVITGFVCCLLGLHLTLKIEALHSSETSVNLYQTIRRSIPKDGTLHTHRCDSLLSQIYLQIKWILYLEHKKKQVSVYNMAMDYLIIHIYVTEHSDILLGRVHMTTWPFQYSCVISAVVIVVNDMAAVVIVKQISIYCRINSWNSA